MRLDEFADGVVTYVDAGKLLALRLSEAGFDVTLDEYAGGHTAKDKLSELIGYFTAQRHAMNTAGHGSRAPGGLLR